MAPTSSSCQTGSNRALPYDETKISAVPVDDAKPNMAGSSVPPVEMIQDRRQAVHQPSRAVMARPVPAAQIKDPQQFQLGQIRRRFKPKENIQGQHYVLKFNLTPSDPDFPFVMTALECQFYVPLDYPKSRPTLKVGNKDIPRGFALNVETGFNVLAQEKTSLTLLELLKALDKDLETFLSAPKVDTVKLVTNKDTRHLDSLPSRALEPAPISVAPKAISATSVTVASADYTRTYSAEEKQEAAWRREAETRQLEARMGRLPLFKKSSDGIAYTIPIEPRRRAELPITIQAVKLVQLFVPLLYPLQSPRVKLDGVDPAESKPVEKGFEKKAAEQREVTLMGHVNFLAQNMHNLAKTVMDIKKQYTPLAVESFQGNEIKSPTKGKEPEGLQDPERSHIQYIQRPSEWTMIDHDADSDLDSDDLYSYDSDDYSSADIDEGVIKIEHTDGEEVSQPPAPTQEKGTAISFPFMELYGIELLEIVTLNVTVKCERCKDITEIKGLKSGGARTESCKKCAIVLNVTFRRDFVHANSVRAGFLDLDGCVVADMLLSSFLPTCSNCSTAYPLPGLPSGQGETTHNICRECHHKFSFKIPSVKFLRISSSHLPPTTGPRRKKETLGITPGTPLPRTGRCRHYTKSFRWFRFSCCQKVYACDKCHDASEEHPNEWANRMICGWCSRESNYRPEDCGVCHGNLVGKKGTGGFWEGGKGTRDRVKMSRKDKRKHRRPGGAGKAK